MKQSVKVIKAGSDDRILVGCDRSACEGCKGSFFCTNKNNEFEVSNPDKIKVSAGDDIEINLPGKKTVASVLISLGLPLALFIPGYMIGTLLTDKPLWLLISGLSGIGIGFIGAAVFFHFRGNEFVPTIIRKKEESR